MWQPKSKSKANQTRPGTQGCTRGSYRSGGMLDSRGSGDQANGFVANRRKKSLGSSTFGGFGGFAGTKSDTIVSSDNGRTTQGTRNTLGSVTRPSTHYTNTHKNLHDTYSFRNQAYLSPRERNKQT